MTAKIIKTDKEYQDALGVASAIAKLDPAPGSADADRLELISLLIEEYERRHYNFPSPDPISAIEFRMEEQGLKPKDLIPILGSRSRVSEVLGRKRPLSIQMIRAVVEGLGIPAAILIQPTEPPTTVADEFDWKAFPFKEMQRRGWIPEFKDDETENVGLLVQNFVKRADPRLASAPHFRRTLRGLGAASLQERAACSVMAWTARILHKANDQPRLTDFRLDSLSESVLLSIAKMSSLSDGPVRACEFLKSLGIAVVIEAPLPGTLLDGAAFLDKNSRPIIGLTLRFDRVDYFWFTLLHELAHVWRHLNHPFDGFVDRIDADDGESRIEKEANRIARDALVPRELWARSVARISPSVESIIDFSAVLQVHPAIIAGRVRFDSGDFKKFGKLLGQGTVRNLFS